MHKCSHYSSTLYICCHHEDFALREYDSLLPTLPVVFQLIIMHIHLLSTHYIPGIAPDSEFI